MNNSGKVSKDYASYRSSPNGPQCCAKCTMFRQPQSCTTVNGKISPAGYCKYYEKKKDAEE